MLRIDVDGNPDGQYCEHCEMWINGPTQWEDHLIGKKHKKNKSSKGIPKKRKVVDDPESIPGFCNKLCESTLENMHVVRTLQVSTDFSPALLSQWGLEEFPLPWLAAEKGTPVYDCRHVNDATIPFIFGRVEHRCGYIPKAFIDQMQSNSVDGMRDSASSFGVSTAPAGFCLSNESSRLADNVFYGFECAICQESFQIPIGLFQAISCNHHACLDCKQKWIMSQVDANILPVRCFGCLAIGKQNSGESNTWPEFYVRASLSEKQFINYLAASLRIWSSSCLDARGCNTPDCQGLTFVQAGQENWTCLLCHTVWCVHCRKSHRPSMSCTRFAEQEIADEEMDILIASGVVKQCPACKSGVQKSQGCNKMTCATCRTLFCYVCGCKLDRVRPYSHFKYGSCKLFDEDTD